MNTSDIERCRKRIIQYLWDPEPQNDEEPKSPIWCLGIGYPPPNHAVASPEGHVTDNDCQETTASINTPTWPEPFLLDFESRIWMTYRSNFAPIQRDTGTGEGHPSLTLSVRLRNQLMDPQGFTSDTGWGCMIRSGQSLLANAMAILSMGRGWRRSNELKEEVQILRLFADSPDAPFSIHKFVKHGAEFCGKHPGEWFGPSATARCIQGLSAAYGQSTLRVYITDNSDVFEDKFMSVSRSEQGVICPTLILLGLRLGIDRITPAYREGLKTVLQFPQAVGIAGGRPSASHYFVGVQGSHFFYLDPHTTRPASVYNKLGDLYTKDEVDTYHTRRLRRLHIQDMDPSMLIGFLIKDEGDWKDWKTRVASAQGKPIINIISENETVSWQGRKEALDEVEAFDDDE
ncbi:hypothetical protein BDV12DRAFT_175310 [Aspergillus spectabilis]